MGWFRRRPSWQELHPLPPGWRPRTRIDQAGREVEPWLWLIVDAAGAEYDGGERWLPMGFEPDQAAWTILEHWLRTQQALARHELPGLRLTARKATIESRPSVGVAYAQEQALTS